METLGKVDTVVLDKTGTLTLGNPEVVSIDPADGIGRERLLRVAASAERYLRTSLGARHFEDGQRRTSEWPTRQRFSYTPGKGISCRVDGEETVVGTRAFLLEHGVAVPALAADQDSSTEILVAQGGVHLGSLRIADVLRPEAVEAVRALREMSIRTVLLTGDTASIGRAVGHQLQVDEVEAELLPQQKLDRVREVSAAPGRRSRWSATVSTTLSRLWKPTWESRWAPAPRSPAKAPMCCFSATTC